MVDREVDGPVWVVLGRFGGLCVRSWAALGAFVGGPGPLLWPLLAVLGRSWASAGGLGPSWGLCWRSWAAPGALWAVLGRSWGLSWRSWAALGAAAGGPGSLLGPILAVLGRSWALCWRSWAALGAYAGGLGPKNAKNMATLKMCLFLERERDLWPRGQSGAALGSCLGGLGPLLGPMLAVLGRSWGLSSRSWGLCWRSWAALGIYVGGLGPLLAVLGGLGPKSGPNPSGNKGPKGSNDRSLPRPPEAPRRFFSAYPFFL